jgi:hypothetical protein
MGKKQRRKQQPVRTTDYVPAAATPSANSQPVAFVEARRPVAPVPSGARSRQALSWQDLREQYTHVNAELKEIGIIAGSFMVVLLILTAVLG